MTQRFVWIDILFQAEITRANHPLVTAPCQFQCARHVSRQKLKEFLETARIKSKGGWKLPQNWSQLFLQSKHPLSEKICERFLNVLELFHVSDKAATL